MVKHFLFVFLCACALTALVHAQDQSGFISIDCGIPENSNYIDATTGIRYVSDAAYIDTGVSRSISPQYKSDSLDQQFSYVRSFPDGIKNCYTLTPPNVKGNVYLVRALFKYGNYDTKNTVPKFNLQLGVDYWDTVAFSDNESKVRKEILHAPSSSNYLYVCLVNTGNGTPFISGLELRLVGDDMYEPGSPGSMALVGRYDFRAYIANDQKIIRFKDDIYDRIWEPPFGSTKWSELSTSLTVDPGSLKLPSAVMSTAVTPQNANESLNFYWEPISPDTQYYFYLHFADFQANQSREFNIFLNYNLWYRAFQPKYLHANTVYTVKAESTTTLFNFSITKTYNSTLPPILNALEIYMLKHLLSPPTDQGDVVAIVNIKSTYGVKKNWQGDPCNPEAYSWEGLNCSYAGTYDTPRITSLDLSLSGLIGKISPSIFNLKLLQHLDLSNNSLTGEVPVFLSQMQKLTVLILTGNNFTGTVPVELIERAKSGSLSLHVEGNPNLCVSDPCDIQQTMGKKKEKSMVVPIVASVAGVCVLLIAFAILWMCMLKRRKSKQRQVVSLTTSRSVAPGSYIKDMLQELKNHQFTYSDTMKITKNYQRVIQKGGFGTVYHRLNFLPSDNLWLIYEWMANGNIHGHVSGMDYLCSGCKPPNPQICEIYQHLFECKIPGQTCRFLVVQSFPT